MAKASGGTRNYSNSPKTLSKRRAEFDGLMATGKYDDEYSEFDASGGFVVVHKEYNRPNEIQSNVDKSEYAIDILIGKGYKIYLNSEASTIEYDKKNDGRIYKSPMDIKTINKAGKNTIATALKKASTQGVETVILVQNTHDMKREYVEHQLKLFVERAPQKAIDRIQNVIVVGISGNVHRRHMSEYRK